MYFLIFGFTGYVAIAESTVIVLEVRPIKILSKRLLMFEYFF